MNDIDRSCSYESKVDTPMYEYYYEKDGSIKYFINLLKNKGFVVQKGSLQYIDMLKLVNEGKSSTALGNITGAPYAVCILPPAPNQEPSPQQKPPRGFDPNDADNYPPNVEFIMPGLNYKLRTDEAIVLIGKTPPPSVYFSSRSYLTLVKNKPEKDYSNTITAGNRSTGCYHFIGASLGDQISNSSIWTNSTPYGTPGNPCDACTIIITTADRGINKLIRDALTNSGFNPGIMNNDNIPKGLVNMGLEKGKDHFSFVMRANIFQNPDIGWDYIYNLEKHFTVLRITPEKPYAAVNPWPIEALKRKETGTTEFQVIPNARNTLDYLRNQIIKKYGNPEYDIVNFDFDLAIPDAYECILQDKIVWVDNRDTIYIKTENFELASDDDFIIVYGVNSTQTGFATFINVSLYGDEFWNGVAGTVFANDIQFPADEYFPKGNKNSKYYYAVKLARQATEGNEIIIPYSTDNPKGSAYGVDNNQKVFLVIRMYVNQETKVASSPYDIIWGHAILFTKKK